MSFRASVIAVLLAAFAATAQPVRAQSLADLARKEQERRKTTQPGAKVYTNRDLPDVVVPAAAAPAADAAADTTAGQAVPPPATTGPAGSTDVAPVKDQAYWSGRMKTLQTALQRDQVFAQALQVQVDALNTDFVNRSDPAQQAIVGENRQKALDELARVKTAIDESTKAIADLEDEARRASVPPGWLR